MSRRVSGGSEQALVHVSRLLPPPLEFVQVPELEPHPRRKTCRDRAPAAPARARPRERGHSELARGPRVAEAQGDALPNAGAVQRICCLSARAPAAGRGGHISVGFCRGHGEAPLAVERPLSVGC
jgi:hypothetical protein